MIGYIDGYGAIHARTSPDVIMHTDAERLSGRPFRWSVQWQEFEAVLGCVRLSEDDYIRILSWLKNKGYCDEDAHL